MLSIQQKHLGAQTTKYIGLCLLIPNLGEYCTETKLAYNFLVQLYILGLKQS